MGEFTLGLKNLRGLRGMPPYELPQVVSWNSADAALVALYPHPARLGSLASVAARLQDDVFEKKPLCMKPFFNGTDLLLYGVIICPSVNRYVIGLRKMYFKQLYILL